MKIKKKRRITCSTSDRREIARQLGCSNLTVISALCANRDSALAHRIRREAIRRGGYEVIVSPIDKAWEDDGEVMRQYYPDGVEIVIDKADASISVLDGDKIISHVVGVGLDKILDAQRKALKVSKEKEKVL